MTTSDTAASERLAFPTDVVEREALHLLYTDERVFGAGFGVADAANLSQQPEIAERVDAFVARFGRLQDTLANALLPLLLETLLEPAGSVIDNLNCGERLGLIASVESWRRQRQQRNRMVHASVRDPQLLIDALLVAHDGRARARRLCRRDGRQGAIAARAASMTPC